MNFLDRNKNTASISQKYDRSRLPSERYGNLVQLITSNPLGIKMFWWNETTWCSKEQPSTLRTSTGLCPLLYSTYWQRGNTMANSKTPLLSFKHCLMLVNICNGRSQLYHKRRRQLKKNSFKKMPIRKSHTDQVHSDS